MSSYSELSTFEKCPQLWKKRYVDKIWAPKTEALEFGDVVHRLIAAKLSNSLANPSFGGSDPKFSKVLADMLVEKAVQVTKDLNLTQRELRHIGFSVEQRLENNSFVGIIDLMAWDLNQELWVLDWKTVSDEYRDSEIFVSDQLTAYAWLVYQTYSYIPDHVAFVTLNKDSGVVQVLSGTRTKQDIADWSVKISNISFNIKNHVIHKNPNSCMSYWGDREYLCDFFEDCWGHRTCQRVEKPLPAWK